MKLLLCAALLAACTPLDIRREAYPDGSRKSEAAYLAGPDRIPVRHGVQTTWYPDGERESMEIFVAGYLQGYAIRWYPDGRLRSLEHFTDGIPDGEARHWDEAGTLIACRTAEGGDCLPSGGSDGPDRPALATGP